MLNIYNFEDVIDPSILGRGLDYYRKGRVDLLEKMAEGVYRADVIGSRRYTVDMILSQQLDVTQTRCDCPYDLGLYCKHQVAVLYALHDRLMQEGSDIMQVTPSADSSIADSSINVPDLARLLQRQTKEELIAFIIKSSSLDSIFRRQVMLQFAASDDQARQLRVD